MVICQPLLMPWLLHYNHLRLSCFPWCILLSPHNFAYVLFSVSWGKIVTPRRNWKHYICKMIYVKLYWARSNRKNKIEKKYKLKKYKKRIKAQKGWAQMEHSDPCRAPTLGKYKDRCGYTKPFLQSSSRKNSLDWVRSRFWSLSCLRLHINKFPKGKKKVEFCFVVNIIVNIEDWNKL